MTSYSASDGYVHLVASASTRYPQLSASLPRKLDVSTVRCGHKRNLGARSADGGIGGVEQEDQRRKVREEQRGGDGQAPVAGERMAARVDQDEVDRQPQREMKAAPAPGRDRQVGDDERYHAECDVE